MKYFRLVIVYFITFIISLSYSLYLLLSRESALWWSNISDIEKLISFRTEQGLYFSYYQEFIKEGSVINGLYVLYNNTLTEYPNGVNIIRRMNVWQEIFLGCAYLTMKYVGINVSPIEFYVNSVLFLQGLLVASIFLLSCSINKSILAGLLTIAFFALNRNMVSRLAYTLPLRESFALPFWWLHILALHMMIKPKKPNNAVRKIVEILFYVSTFLFCLLWQFSQFVIFLEICVVFVLSKLEFMSSYLTFRYYMTCLVAIVATSIMQMGNTMLLSSYVVAFLISSLLLDYVKTPVLMESSFSGRITWMSIQATSRVVCAILIRMLLNAFFQQNDDSHIFNFVIAKFGIGRSRDFYVNLYLCHDGFKWLSIDKFASAMKMVNYPYMMTYIILGIMVFLSSITILWHDTEEEEELHPSVNESVVGAEGDFCGGCGHFLSNQPELVYHFGLNTVSLLLALIVQRMQFFLVPYMLIFASMAYGNMCFYCNLAQPLSDVFGLFFDSPIESENEDEYLKIVASRRCNFIRKIVQYSRQAIISGVLCLAIVEVVRSVQAELHNLRELYDPDTVELMHWIKKSTLLNESFSGSMQLMAAVKLIAERPIVNHPHFEDANLRSKTRKLYQFYAHQTPEYVHRILQLYKVKYIILEDSICLAKSDGCQLKDLLDIDNGHMPETKYYSDYDLYYSNIPRFCNAIRHLNSFTNNSFKVFFTEMFVNPTFRVYRVD